MFGRRKQRAQFHNQVPYEMFPVMNQPMMGMGSHPQLNFIRQYSNPYFPNEQGNWSPYMQANPTYGSAQVGNYPYYPYQSMQNTLYNPYPLQANYPFQHHAQQSSQNSFANNVFQNPLEPESNQLYPKAGQPFSPNPYMNPYPKQSFLPKQPSGVQSIMNSFKSQDGSLDINKMMDTAGSMMNAVSQVSSMVKGLGGIIKI